MKINAFEDNHDGIDEDEDGEIIVDNNLKLEEKEARGQFRWCNVNKKNITKKKRQI